MADPPDAGNPIRLISPFHKIVGVGWGTNDLWALLAFKCTFYSDGIGLSGDEDTFNYTREERLGITPRWTAVAAHGGGNTFLATTGSFSTNEASCASDPGGFSSKYIKGGKGLVTPYPFVNPFFDPTSTGVPGGGSLDVNENIGDLTGYNAVWENGLQNHLELSASQLVDARNMIPFGTNYELFRPDLTDSGTSIFDLEMYAIVNLGKIIKDVGGLELIAKLQIDIVAQRASQNPPSGPDGDIPLREKQVDIKYYKGNGVKFVGGAGRTIVADLSSGGTHLADLDDSTTFAWSDCPFAGGVVHTFTYETGNT